MAYPLGVPALVIVAALVATCAVTGAVVGAVHGIWLVWLLPAAYPRQPVAHVAVGERG